MLGLVELGDESAEIFAACEMGGSGRASHDAHLRRKVRAEDGAPSFEDGTLSSEDGTPELTA